MVWGAKAFCWARLRRCRDDGQAERWLWVVIKLAVHAFPQIPSWPHVVPEARLPGRPSPVTEHSAYGGQEAALDLLHFHLESAVQRALGAWPAGLEHVTPDWEPHNSGVQVTRAASWSPSSWDSVKMPRRWATV